MQVMKQGTLVYLYDSVPWTFISSSKVISSLEDLHKICHVD